MGLRKGGLSLPQFFPHLDSRGRMDGADVWLSVRDRALRNPHIFQNALKVVYDNLPF